MPDTDNPIIFPDDSTWPSCLSKENGPSVRCVSKISALDCIKITIGVLLEQSKRSDNPVYAKLAREIAEHTGITLEVDS